MKILMITGEYPPMSGGIAGYTELLCRELSSVGVQCIVLSDQRSAADCTVSGWSWDLRKSVASLVNDAQVDVVHIQYQAGAYRMHPAVNLLPRMLHHVPVVTTFHDLRPPYLFPKAGGMRNAIMKRMARWSDASIVTNPTDARILAESGIATESIRLGPSLPPPTIISDEHPIGFFGFPSRQKGFELLVASVGQMSNADLKSILIVGSEPPVTGHHGFMNRDEAEDLGARHGVSVAWTGYLESQQASNALAGCRIIAFPFPSGATLRSSALIATLQTGRPVITTMPHHKDELEDLVTMPQLSLVQPGDLNGLTEKLEYLLNRNTSTQTTSPLPESFQWATIASQHRRLYESRVLRGSR